MSARKALTLLVLAVVVTIASLLVPDDAYLEEASCRDCNVILVTLGTTRADHLGVYGYEYDTSPFIDSLARQAHVYLRAYSTQPLTQPAHASILTSLYPFQHGIRDNGMYYLPGDAVTLAEVLKNEDFETGAFVSSTLLESKIGFGQGFNLYDDDMGSVQAGQRDAARVTDAAVKWITGKSGGRFFAWIHYFDPHGSYNPPQAYRGRFSSNTSLYDGEIAYVDDQLKRLVTNLIELGLDDNTVIVIIADHGEAFGEHREYGHGNRVYDTTVKVPFIIFNPQSIGGVLVDDIVQNIDVPPTILGILGVRTPPVMSGVNVFGNVSIPDRYAYSETYSRSRVQPGDYHKSIRTNTYTYIYRSKARNSYFIDSEGSKDEDDYLIEPDTELDTHFEELLRDFEEENSGLFLGNNTLDADD